jgi:hypothetical protein
MADCYELIARLQTPALHCRETAGVRVRVELGPKDAESGTAVVALAGTPGTVAKKQTVNMAVQLIREVRSALAKVGPQVDSSTCESARQQRVHVVKACWRNGRLGTRRRIPRISRPLDFKV